MEKDKIIKGAVVLGVIGIVVAMLFFTKGFSYYLEDEMSTLDFNTREVIRSGSDYYYINCSDGSSAKYDVTNLRVCTLSNRDKNSSHTYSLGNNTIIEIEGSFDKYIFTDSRYFQNLVDQISDTYEVTYCSQDKLIICSTNQVYIEFTFSKDRTSITDTKYLDGSGNEVTYESLGFSVENLEEFKNLLTNFVLSANVY